MRAVICRAWGEVEDLTIEDIALPQPGPGEVLIAVKATAVNYADALLVAGCYQTRPPLPFSPGLETAGIVMQCGAGVTRFRPGDRVMAILPYGGLAEQALAAEDETFAIPDGMRFEEAGAFPIAYISSHVALRWQGRLTAGETLLVLGDAGGVGLTAVEIGKVMGARVIAGASTAEKLAVAQEHGADDLINYTRRKSAMFDLIIQHARLCDGTGTPCFLGTLGVTDGHITYLGRDTGLAAQRTIDADGLVLAPGFIDPHTHYDAQIAWDPLLTSSPWHGVTTVVMGNCGVGVAPVKPAMRDILLHDLVNVEAIPYEVMQAGIDWQWESYGEYLDAVDRRGLGINVAALVPLTPLRHYVLGEASFERPATPEETATMRSLLREAMHAGAFGLSTTTSQNHTGSGARPLACRNASQEELAGVCQALRDVGRGTIEIVLNSAGMHPIDETDVALLRLLTHASGRPVTWLALFARPGEPDFHHTHTVPRLGDLLTRAIPQVSPRPIFMQGDLRNPTMYSTYRAWQPAFQRPVAEQIALYQQPAFRAAFVEDIALRKREHLWEQTRVLEVMHPALASYEGKTIYEIAALQGKRPVDAYLDLAVADALQTRFQTALFNYDEAGVERLIRDARFLIGLSDGGAHVDVLCDAGYATALLDIWVRQRQALTLEQAVHKLTAVPAALFGIPHRGTLAVGNVADLVLFDPQTVAAKPPEYVRDFPRQGRRLISKAEGIVATFVAGTQVYAQGTHTGAFPGRVLRSDA